MATEVSQTLISDGQNVFIDPSCASRQDTIGVNLSTTRQYGQVDMCTANALNATVGAGSLTLGAGLSFGQFKTAMRIANFTLSSTSGTTNIEIDSPKVENAIAKAYEDATMSFQCTVYHDIGSAIDFRLVALSADAENDFSTATAIETGSDVSVADVTATVLKLENVSMGDVSNGFALRVQVETGDVTTKNIYVTDWSGVKGAKAQPVQPYDVNEHLIRIKRRLNYMNFDQESGEEIIDGCRAIDTNTMVGTLNYPEMDTNPDTGFTSTESASGTFLAVGPVSSAAGDSKTFSLASRRSMKMQLNTLGTPFTAGHAGAIRRNATQTCWLKIDSRLV